jgi:ABC-type spermidine/putrescine transport system permease subunit I
MAHCRPARGRRLAASGAARLRWAFPPQEYGLANYLAMFEEDLKVIIDTVVIAVAATVMAVLIGFTLAWILTRRWCCSTSP